MSARVKVLLGIVIALAGARVLVALTRPSAEHGIGSLVVKIDPSKVAGIALERSGKRLLLERDPKSPTGWVVATAHGKVPARKGAPDSLLTRLRGWRRERLAGRDRAQHAEWHVTDDLARRITLRDEAGKVLLDLLVGRITGIDTDRARERGFNVAVDELGLLVRKAGEDEVVVVGDFVTRHLEPAPAWWFLRPLVAGEPDAVRALTHTGQAGSFTLALRPRPARLQGDRRPPDPARSYGLLTNVYLLEPKGAAPQGTTPPPGAATTVRVVTRQGASSLTLWPVGERWFARSERLGAATVEVKPHEAKQIAAATREGLIQERLLTLNPGDLRRLHWERATEELSLARDTRDFSWAATLTGPARPLTSRRHPRSGMLAVLEQIIKLPVARWEVDASKIDPAFAGALERLVLKRRGQKPVVLELGQVVGGLRAVRGKALPLPAWIEEAELQKRWTALRGLAE